MRIKIARQVGVGVLTLLLLTGCQTTSTSVPMSAELTHVLSGEAWFGQPIARTQLPQYDLFSLPIELKNFAEQAVGGARTSSQKAEALHAALFKPLDKGGAGLQYEGFITEIPIDAFNSKQVNCASFTLLYVSLARYLKLDAVINEVEIPPQWDFISQDAYAFMRHVNAKVLLPGGDQLIIDLEMARYRPHYPQRVVKDDIAVAQFYNNRGMELAAAGDLSLGFLHLRKAIEVDPKQSYIWGNLGTLYRRANLMNEAETAYLHGLSMNTRDLTIISNLSAFYQQQGKIVEAKKYTELAQTHRDSNPFYHYAQALQYFNRGDYLLAQEKVKRALKLRKNYGMFLALHQQVEQALLASNANQ